jgi:putative component of membrane protein insertase Oxa1/YidC/SpoIIIJ protein YidD
MSDRNLLAVSTIAAVFCALLPCNILFAHDPTELEFILSCSPLDSFPEEESVRSRSDVKHPFGIESLLKGAIRFYQVFISSQDMPACNFVPSCSQFGAEAISRLGVVRGVLLTSDRLQRCNGVSTSRYQIDYNSGRLIDPIQVYCEMLR